MKLFSISRCRLGFRISLLLLLQVNISACRKEEGALASKPRLVPYIMGDVAFERRFPYVCSLSRRGDKLHRCGGFLIRPQWVVTAAHCIDPSLDSIGRNPFIRCGSHKSNTNDSEKIFSGEESYWPDAWTGNVEDGYDIAVVKLNKKANLPLPSIDTQGDDYRAGTMFTALGWGLDETGKNPNSLKMAENLAYVKQHDCKEFLGDAVKKHSICAGDSKKNTCRGDSGGPLLIPDRLGDSVVGGNPRHDLIVGVTSTGSENCNDSSPTIYTSIGAFWDWIEEKIGEEEIGQPCLVESPPTGPGVRFPEVDEPAKDKLKEESLNRQELEDERNRLSELLQKTLIREAYRAMKDDNALKLKAALLEGLDSDSFHKSRSRLRKSNATVILRTTFSLLHWSAYYNAFNCAKVLLEDGAIVNQINDDRDTPLHVAAASGHTNVVKVLLNHDANVNAVNVYGNTSLHWAAQNRHSRTVKVLIKHGAKVNKVDNGGWTPLNFAVVYADINLVKILLKHGAKVDVIGKNGRTPLHIAVVHARANVVKILLEHGAKVDIADEDGWTPLHYAAMTDDANVFKILLDYGADVDIVYQKGWTPLQYAAKSANVSLVEILLENGAKIDVVDEKGMTALHYAVVSADANVVEMLLEHGAKVDIVDEDGWMPIHYAASLRNPEVVKLLLEADADVLTSTTATGNTPLHAAAWNGRTEIVKILLDAGASKTVVNMFGHTPFDFVCRGKTSECSDTTRTYLETLLRP